MGELLRYKHWLLKEFSIVSLKSIEPILIFLAIGFDYPFMVNVNTLVLYHHRS